MASGKQSPARPRKKIAKGGDHGNRGTELASEALCSLILELWSSRPDLTEPELVTMAAEIGNVSKTRIRQMRTQVLARVRAQLEDPEARAALIAELDANLRECIERGRGRTLSRVLIQKTGEVVEDFITNDMVVITASDRRARLFSLTTVNVAGEVTLKTAQESAKQKLASVAKRYSGAG